MYSRPRLALFPCPSVHTDLVLGPGPGSDDGLFLTVLSCLTPSCSSWVDLLSGVGVGRLHEKEVLERKRRKGGSLIARLIRRPLTDVKDWGHKDPERSLITRGS